MKKKLNKYIKKVIEIFRMRELRVLPGNLAFFFVMALIPIITVILTWFSGYASSLIKLINEVFPPQASAVLTSVISSKEFGRSNVIFNIIAFFLASNGTYAIINAANTLYKIDKSDALKDRIRAIILLIILIGLIVFLLVVPMFGGKILSLFSKIVFYKQLLTIYNILKWPITFFLIYVVLKLIFTIAPSKNIKSRDTTYGALFTTFIWTVSSVIFGYYLQNIADYSIMYGNLSSIIVLMMWIYLISYVFVLGMTINSIEMFKDK